MTSTLELEYLKKQFFKSSSLNMIYPETLSVSQKNVLAFQENLQEKLIIINEANTLEDFKHNLHGLHFTFLNTWDLIKGNPTPEKSLMEAYYSTSKINHIHEWLEQEQQLFKDKVTLQFFTKAATTFNTFFNKITANDSSESFSNMELEELSKMILKKYNLASINLSDAKSNEDAFLFLQEFDTKATICFDKLGVKPEVFGIHKTISLNMGSAFGSNGLFNPNTSSISLSTFSIKSKTILHEWIHALDYHVHFQHTGYLKGTSENEFSYVDNNTPISQAYKTIRNLTQQIFNKNTDDINKIKEEKLQDGASKFWAVALGESWYGFSNDSQNKLLSTDTVRKINNFLAIQNKETSHDLFSSLENLKETNIVTPEVAFNTIMNNKEIVKSYIKPLFDSINHNLVSDKSFYYLSSHISNASIIANSYIGKGVRKTQQLLGFQIEAPLNNSEDNDYYTQPTEMLARYFEGQVFPVAATISGMLSFSMPYKITKDQNFEENKNNLISHVFSKEHILKNISSIRESSNPINTHISHTQSKLSIPSLTNKR